MAHSKAEVRLVERAQNDLLIARANRARLNVDSRRDDVPSARPYIVVIHGEHGDDLDLPDLWEDIPDVEVVSLEEGDGSGG